MADRNETSIWKKEISFRRKPEPPAAAAPVPSSPAPATPASTSVWKKEISLRRKPKPEAPEQTLAELFAQAPPVSVAPEPPVSAAPAPPVSAAPEPPVGGPEPTNPEANDAAFLPPTAPAPEASLPTLPPVSSPPPAPPYTAPPEPPLSSPVPPELGELAPTTTDLPAAGGAADPIVPAVPAPPPVPVVAAVAASDPVPEPAPEPAVLPAPSPEPPAVSEQPDPEATPAPAAKLSRRERKEQRRATERSTKDHPQLVGLKLGASQVAAAQVINKGGPKVVRMARQPLQRGIVVGGELREPEELASVLKAFFKKHKLPRNCVRLGISNNRIGVRTFEISGISDPKQLANAVRFRAQETLPIALDEAVVDYRLLDDRVAEDGSRVCRVLLVVAHKELVERYVAACRKAGLKLVGIDLEAFALLRALSDPAQPPGEDAAVVCVSIGHDRSTLAVSDGRVCEFTRVLAWGGATLDTALARVLDQTPSAVVPIKHALVLGEEGAAAGLDARHADEARRAMTVELQSFARELVASLRFYQEQPGSLGIVEILITGGATACGGLPEELERLIGIPVRVADPLARVKVARSMHDEESLDVGSMAVAVGLGIEG